MRFQSLTVIVTLRCTAQCAHCVTHSSPGRNEAIHSRLAARAVEEAARLGLSIVFSGGEPLLEFDLVIDLARRAQSWGVPTAVYSNGYWAQTEVLARRVVEKLAAAGVTTLLLSTDPYHLPFVPLESVEFAARTAVRAGLHCEVAVPSPADCAETCSQIVERLRRLPDVLIKVHPVSKSGRAQELGSAVFAHGIHDRPCPVLGQLMLMPDGYLYACCAASIHFERQSVLCGGNLNGSSLEDAMAKWNLLPLLSDIQTHGPLRAGFREAERNPRFSMEIRNSYSDICAECHDVCSAYDRSQGLNKRQEEGLPIWKA